MKQKVVLNVSYDNKRKPPCFIFSKRTKPSKALKIAAASHGVQSVGWKEGKNQLEVNGDDIDVVLLTKKLIKQIGHTTIASLEEKKEEKKEEEQKEFPYHLYTPMPYQYVEVPDSYHGICTIM